MLIKISLWIVNKLKITKKPIQDIVMNFKKKGWADNNSIRISVEVIICNKIIPPPQCIN